MSKGDIWYGPDTDANLVFGIPDPRARVDESRLPEGWTRYRVRARLNDYLRIFIRFRDGSVVDYIAVMAPSGAAVRFK